MKRLVLLGGGHAQVKVLASLASSPLQGWDVRLVTPYRRQIYSGMLPGWIAGHYALEACELPLDALAERAGVGFHQTVGVGVDLVRNELLCANGTRLAFDLLSIDTGPEPALAALPGARDHALPVRPIEQFIAAWPTLLDRMLAQRAGFELVILGAGAAGIELAFAIHHRCAHAGGEHVRITVVGDAALPMPGAPLRLQRSAARLFRERGIRWLGSRQATRVTPTTVEVTGAPLALRAFPPRGSDSRSGRPFALMDGGAVPFDACLVVTGAAAPLWPAASGLATDAQGFISVGPTLQSVSHPYVFAAGDVAAYHDGRPKSGVFAVRAGPVLADNLRAACTGSPLRSWRPQRRALYLVSTGGRHALAAWGGWSLGGGWVWRWKDRIDRRFVRQFAA